MLIPILILIFFLAVAAVIFYLWRKKKREGSLVDGLEVEEADEERKEHDSALKIHEEALEPEPKMVLPKSATETVLPKPAPKKAPPKPQKKPAPKKRQDLSSLKSMAKRPRTFKKRRLKQPISQLRVMAKKPKDAALKSLMAKKRTKTDSLKELAELPSEEQKLMGKLKRIKKTKSSRKRK
ncbi:hypothetical protein GOV09_06260 [Candidatus Woesearchaeota archaeon]|nr:hypothetical protein [Candidatus Woesearchaeota archaeon]